MYNYQINVDYDITSDNIKELDKYRTLFLKTMKLKEFDNNKINKIYDNLLPKLEACEDFKKLFKLNWNYPLIDTNWTILLMMFSFQSFKYMHLCLQDFFTTNKVSHENIEKLKKSLEYLVKK
jgi:hypothetical protein